MTPANSEPAHEPPSGWWHSEDAWAIACGAFLLAVSFLAVWSARPQNLAEMLDQSASVRITNPLGKWLSKPGSWAANPLDAFYRPSQGKAAPFNSLPGTLGAFLALAVVCAIAMQIRKQAGIAFLQAFPGIFLLAVVAYVMAGQSVVKAYNLEYALWALLVGLIVCNTVGTPEILKPAVLTEFYIKTGLVLLGAEVLFNRLLALGAPGIIVSWVVTPIVLIATFIFGQKV